MIVRQEHWTLATKIARDSKLTFIPFSRVKDNRGLMKTTSSLLSDKPQRTWFWLGITAIFGVALTAGWALYLEQNSFVALRNTYELIISTDRFLSTSKNAEIGALRYVLTGQPDDLHLFNDSRKVLAGQGDRFRTLVENDLVENDPSQLAQVETLEGLIQRRLGELSAAIRARDSAGIETARTMLLTEQGQRLIDDTRTVITEMKNAEQNTLDRFSLTRRSRVHTGLVALSCSALLALCCLLIGHVMLSRNIFARAAAEERLRESEERFRVIFFQAAVGIAQTSIDGHWLLLNDRFCEMLGYSRDEIKEKTFIEIMHPDDRESSLTARDRLVAGEISSWSSEKRYIRKDRVTVWATLFVSIVRDENNQPAYFVSVVEDITEKVEAVRALRRSREELRALAGRLINAQESERKRISRELHDDLSQKLALLAIDTGSIVMTLPPAMDELMEQIRNVQTRVVQLAQDVRKISHQLHPTILEDLGLIAALGELCDEFSAREGTRVLYEHEALRRALPVEVAACLYRVTQEALHNISKHAHATQVQLRVSGSDAGVYLYIHDTGVGFASKAVATRRGLGIVSMKERVALVHGEFSIRSEPGQGTELSVFVPVSGPEVNGSPNL